MLNSLFFVVCMDVPSPFVSNPADVVSPVAGNNSMIIIAVVVAAVVVVAIVLLSVISRKNRRISQGKDKEA